MTADSGDVNSIHLRNAIGADAVAISDCVAKAYAPWVPRIGQKPWPMLQDYAIVIRDESVTVAQVANEVAGVIVLTTTAQGLLIDNVAVCPRWQGRGIGRTLLQFAEGEARRLACDNVYLYTNELMIENIALYARCGFVEYERRQEQGYRRVFMRKAVRQ